MARRRRQVRRNALVFAGSFVAHVALFLLLARQFQFYPPPPEEATPPVVIEIVPPVEMPPPPTPVPIPPKPQIAPTPKPPAPAPTPQPTPKPAPAPTPEAAATPKPAPQPAAPIKTSAQPTPTPAPKLANAPTPLAPPMPALQPGPPRSVARAAAVQTHTVNQHPLVLHKSAQEAPAFVPSVSIPGAVFAQPAAPSGGPQTAAGAPTGTGASSGGGAFPGGALPGFGNGLRGGVLGCINASAPGINLTAAEKSRCAQAFGAGTKEAPVMSAIDASRRTTLDQEAASEAEAQKYRDSTPAAGTGPAPGQPRAGHSPTE